MNGFAEHKASGPLDHLDESQGLLTWEAANVRLALVGRIAADIVAVAERQARLIPEKNRLDEFRRHLDWAGRSRRYEVDREIAAGEQALKQLEAELNGVGSILLDARSGLVGFPTIVNDRRAFFSWKVGEDRLLFWNYVGESERQAVPPSWIKPAAEVRPAKGRTRSR